MALEDLVAAEFPTRGESHRALALKLSASAPEVNGPGLAARGILRFTMQLETVREVLENFDEVRLAYLFGSVAAGTARPSSDLDVAVLLTPGTGQAVVDRLNDALERASGRTVDLVDLSLVPPLLAHEVVKQRKLIFSRDEAERVEFETRAVARYLDTANLRKVQHEYLRERVEARGAAAR